jgi:hypothetical protein
VASRRFAQSHNNHFYRSVNKMSVPTEAEVRDFGVKDNGDGEYERNDFDGNFPGGCGSCRGHGCFRLHTLHSNYLLKALVKLDLVLPGRASPNDAIPSTSARSLQGEIADANAGELGHAGHSREASGTFSEACTAYLRIVSRIGAIAFGHLRRAALRSIRSH